MLNDYYIHNGTLKTVASYNSDGEPTFSAGTTIKLRLESTSKTFRDVQTGEFKKYDAVAFCASSINVQPGMELMVNSVSYEVATVELLNSFTESHKEISLLIK